MKQRRRPCVLKSSLFNVPCEILSSTSASHRCTGKRNTIDIYMSELFHWEARTEGFSLWKRQWFSNMHVVCSHGDQTQRNNSYPRYWPSCWGRPQRRRFNWQHVNRVISTLNRRAMRAEEGEVGHTRHDNTSSLTHSASYKADSAPLLQWSLLSPMCVCVCVMGQSRTSCFTDKTFWWGSERYWLDNEAEWSSWAGVSQRAEVEADDRMWVGGRESLASTSSSSSPFFWSISSPHMGNHQVQTPALSPENRRHLVSDLFILSLEDKDFDRQTWTTELTLYTQTHIYYVYWNIKYPNHSVDKV